MQLQQNKVFCSKIKQLNYFDFNFKKQKNFEIKKK